MNKEEEEAKKMSRDYLGLIQKYIDQYDDSPIDSLISTVIAKIIGSTISDIAKALESSRDGVPGTEVGKIFHARLLAAAEYIEISMIADKAGK